MYDSIVIDFFVLLVFLAFSNMVISSPTWVRKFKTSSLRSLAVFKQFERAKKGAKR